MGWNYQDGKYSLFVSLFVSFDRDLESKWTIGEPRKNYSVDKYPKESNGITLFVLLKLKQVTIDNLWKGKQNIERDSPL